MITGDITQVDLPYGVTSGMRDAVELLRGVTGISMCTFGSGDVVRHPLVQRIVEAYEARDASDGNDGYERPPARELRGRR